MVAALQYLSARQRAMLILRDVLDWPAAEVATLLDTTTTAVNSGLRRARAQLARALPEEDDVAEPAEPELRALLDRFAVAFENGDVTTLTALLREDVALEMPPILTWFAGREDVRRFLASKLFGTPVQFGVERHYATVGIAQFLIELIALLVFAPQFFQALHQLAILLAQNFQRT